MKKLCLKFSALVMAVIITVSMVNPHMVEASQEKTEQISYCETVVNPVFMGEISKEDISTSFSVSKNTYDAKQYMTSVDEMADYLRKSMVDRQTSVTINMKLQGDYKQTVKDIVEMAIEETGYEEEGDYLAWQFAGYNCDLKGFSDIRNSGTFYYITVTYNFQYYTTKAQEQMVTDKINELFAGFQFSESTPAYEKIKTIYDYICANTEYDTSALSNTANKIPYTAYGALIDKKAVCQGYSCLLYRMLRHAGIYSRFIGSTPLNHAWNIVKIGNWYYNVDVTWDSEYYKLVGEYEYFLRGSGNFIKHTPINAEFSTMEFRSKYPISTSDYVYDATRPEYENNYMPAREAVSYSKETWKAGPGQAKIKTVKNLKNKKIRIKIAKLIDANGYQIRYATNKKLKNAKKATSTKTTVTIKKLKKKKYYIKVRGYRVVDGSKYYGAWSAVKTVKVRK